MSYSELVNELHKKINDWGYIQNSENDSQFLKKLAHGKEKIIELISNGYNYFEISNEGITIQKHFNTIIELRDFLTLAWDEEWPKK